jgi:hypothetical protein
MTNIDEALDTVLDEIFDEIFNEDYTVTDFLSEILTELEEKPKEESRDCKTCIHSNKGKCAGTEECHSCMYESKYEQTEIGHWIYGGDSFNKGMLHCSKCKHEIDLSEDYFQYCPNCGLKMVQD